MTPVCEPTSGALVTLTPQLYEDLVDAGKCAPSPDNNQPWAFCRSEGEVQVLHVRQRAVRSDCNDLFSWLAVGAAIENIVLRASTHGHACAVTYHDRPFPQINGLEHVATVRLHGAANPNPLAQQIRARCTNRKPYARKPPSLDTLARLEHAVGAGSAQATWFTERPQIRRTARLVAHADRIRFEHQPFHEELHAVLRHTPEQAKRTRDGLDVRTLELPGFMLRVLRWLKPWPRMRRLNRLGLSRLLGGVSAQQVKSSGGLAMLTTTDPSDRGYLEAGRAMQRLWLAATAEGLAVQPLGALPLFLLTASQPSEIFSAAHTRWIQTTRERLAPGSNKQPVLLLRLGFSSASPQTRSVRYGTDFVVPIE